MARAEGELRSLAEAFRDREHWYDYALACLDRAVLLLEQGRTAEVKQLAEEMLPLFASRAVRGPALAALVLFQRAAEAEGASVAWVRELAHYLRRARENPRLPFEEPGAAS